MLSVLIPTEKTFYKPHTDCLELSVKWGESLTGFWEQQGRRCHGGRELSAKGSSHCISQREKAAKPRSLWAVTLLPAPVGCPVLTSIPVL